MRGAPLFSAEIFTNPIFCPRTLRRCWVLAVVLILLACQNLEPEQKVEKTSSLVDTETGAGKPAFKADVEKSKQGAVFRFPELSVVGSEMRKAFLRRVNQFKSANASEWNLSNWPLLFATQVDNDLSLQKQKTDPSLKKNAATMARPLERRDFSVPELMQLQSVPFEEIRLTGIITKVEKGVGDNLSGTIFLDRKVRCEFQLSSINYNSGASSLSFRRPKVEFNVRDGALFALFRDQKTSQPTSEKVLFKVGQPASLVGRVRQKNLQTGIIAFKFDLPSHLMP
jgi:hypothetical protein